MGNNDNAFIGLLIYFGSYLFLLYYTCWLLFSVLEANEWVLEYFPSAMYRWVYPGVLFGSALLYLSVVCILRQMGPQIDV